MASTISSASAVFRLCRATRGRLIRERREIFFFRISVLFFNVLPAHVPLVWLLSTSGESCIKGASTWRPTQRVLWQLVSFLWLCGCPDLRLRALYLTSHLLSCRWGLAGF